MCTENLRRSTVRAELALEKLSHSKTYEVKDLLVGKSRDLFLLILLLLNLLYFYTSVEAECSWPTETTHTTHTHTHYYCTHLHMCARPTFCSCMEQAKLGIQPDEGFMYSSRCKLCERRSGVLTLEGFYGLVSRSLQVSLTHALKDYSASEYTRLLRESTPPHEQQLDIS